MERTHMLDVILAVKVDHPQDANEEAWECAICSEAVDDITAHLQARHDVLAYGFDDEFQVTIRTLVTLPPLRSM
jgi:hypothetical protein